MTMAKIRGKQHFSSNKENIVYSYMVSFIRVSVSFSSQSIKQKERGTRGKDLKSVVLNTQRFGEFTSAISSEAQPNRHNFICREQDPILQQE